MGMCRVVLADGQIMHLEARVIQVDDGVLKLKTKDGGQIAIFAPGFWAYYLWVSLEA
jgi:hypothetical protein